MIRQVPGESRRGSSREGREHLRVRVWHWRGIAFVDILHYARKERDASAWRKRATRLHRLADFEVGSQMSEPVFVGLLFADRVIEEIGHKKGIIGTFTTFNSPQYPVMFPPWFIYAAVTNLDPGKYSFAINLSSKDTQLVIFSVGGETDAC